MLRGLYFMGWYRDMWNYHPSLPMKNTHMIDDIGEIKANTLIWSCLGSGAIGLPYLDLEANDKVPPRLRLYGFLNDREFCEECAKRGITVFSVLWKGQLWEFGAEFSDDESELLGLNLLRGAGTKRGYVGMRELSTNRYPKLFAPIEKYFPDGLRDFKGNRIGDFLEEFRAVSLEGRTILSRWLMAPEHDHKCYTPCANKSSYLSYLKRDVEMMADAGAGGLHIDEYDTQKFVISNAGCFCPECVDKFRKYLADNHVALPDDAGSLESFDYGAYLRGKGYGDEDIVASNGTRRFKVPLFKEFTQMQMDSIEWFVGGLAQHFKAYTEKTRGKAAPVTANLFQCYPHSWSCKKYLDILAGEKTKIELRQDGWYKFAFGWLNGKENCFVEDPNEYVRDMLNDIKNNIHDRFITFVLEPMAHGFHIAFPYGSWLQNQVKDAFWPDLRVLKALGNFLDKREALFPRAPVADIAVIYDVSTALENQLYEPTDDTPVPVSYAPDEELGEVNFVVRDGQYDVFFGLVQKLSDENVLYNVVYVSPDEPLTEERLAGYRTVVLPDAFAMAPETARCVNAWAHSGGRILSCGRQAPGVTGAQTLDREALTAELSVDKGLVQMDECQSIGAALHRTRAGYALHLVNYAYNEKTHRIDPLENLGMELKFAPESIRLHSFPENPLLTAELEGSRLELCHLGIYSIVEFTL